MQPDLFQPAEIELTLPEGQQGPRLWVRRIALWQDPQTLLRDIPLRRGVNIVWSPDLSTNGTGATPHGSGKTTFCRLIRYCLGERHFSHEEQRPLMQQKLPNGFVGAEIIIDDECWVITRPFGMNLPSRASRAERIEETFDELLVATVPPTIAPMISESFCTRYRDQVPENLKAEQVWDVLLAWLTRDQECRLDDVFDWRSKRSGSGSPAQELSLETKLTVVRLAIRALSADEIQATAEARVLTRERDKLREKLGHLDWFQNQRFSELCERLSFPKERDPTEELVRKELIDKANEVLAKAVGAEHAKGQRPGDGLREKRQILQSERNKSSDARAEKKALLHSLPSQVAAARAEQGTEQARLETGVIVRCAICHVDIDEVTANGCGISLERCNLDEVRSRIALAEQQIKELERQQLALPAEIDKLDREILRLDREIAQIDGSFAQLEQQMSATNMAVNRASELVRETTWFDLQLKDRVGIAQRLALIDKKLEGARQKTALERERAAAAIGDLAGLFGQLVATLMPKGCFGKMKLDGNGLHPEILLQRGAGLSTAAVESFKIVAFDLAAMILSVNGKADMPSFLIHDSPREADLDAGIYANLFDFALSLEKKGSPPPFQYIVTTTTAPSQITLDHPALRLKLSSTPPEARLFAMDFL
ncbi:chromosome segregation protein SMC [Brucella pseudogrignonensis]|uniref:Putative chromosome segregation SMC protein n=1 Tax=Brucella pseudogrignonensis TaxID=419475 RepID=A0A256G672_9HYPH|nr:chromosome segregation protein SMC [Brucella pseudogrignonensis]OYR22617.1 putative chromosome segregation SMC protein [Brucella pseudogrignonensis]